MRPGTVITPADAVLFLEEAARYFEKRPTCGEDRAHWANVYNAENCRKIAALIGAPPNAALIERLSDEADLCRNEGADDIAALLDEASGGISALCGALEHLLKGALSLPRFAESEGRAALAKVRGDGGATCSGHCQSIFDNSGFHLDSCAALAAGSRRAKTAQPVECEASQSGPKGNAQSQPLGNPLDTGDGK